MTKKSQNHISDDELYLGREFIAEVTDSLFDFCKYILFKDKQEEGIESKKLQRDVHFEMCEFVEGRYLENGETELKPRKLILMPRDSFKSSIVTVGYSIKSLVVNPNLRILIASENFSNSKRYLSEIRAQFESNEILRAFYGEMVGVKDWREDYITVKQRTKILKEPSITCAGLDVVKVGMHYDLIICDDLVSDKNTTSMEMMENVINFYKLLNCLLDSSSESRVIVIGTRWHFNDLYNHIIENEKHLFNYFKRSAHNPDKSLFFPQRLTEKFLEDRKKSMGISFYSCQYENEPIDRAEAAFTKEMITYWSSEDLPDTNSMNRYITLDPAISESKKSDNSAIVVGGVDYDNMKYVLEYFRGKLQPYQLIDKLFEMCKRWNPQAVGIETAVFQKTLKYMFNQKMDEEKIWFNVVELESNWTKSKSMWIAALQPFFEYHQIKIGKNMPEIEDELLRYDKGRYDDLIDALSRQVSLWQIPTKPEEKKKYKGTFRYYMDMIKPKLKNYQIGKYMERGQISG